MLDLSTISKAIAAGLGGLVIAELAKYGLHPTTVTQNALGVIETGVVGYAVGHIAAYIAPKNKETK